MGIITLIVVGANVLFMLAMIFKERKKPESIISWLLLFSFLPIVGFILYVLVGSGLSLKNRRMLKAKSFYNDHYKHYYRSLAETNQFENKKVLSLIKFNINNAKSMPLLGNAVQYFVDGQKQVDAMIADLKKATHSINLEYYIFGNDQIANKVMDVLVQKAQEGVVVNLIYDSVGSLKTKRKYFWRLKKAGGHVKEFFPPLFYIRLINFKMNYRNHRKIAVIDGKIGYVGGINIRADHCGLEPTLAPWCDAHIRVEGQAVHSLQNEFLNFWQYCTKNSVDSAEYVQNGYFPEIISKGQTIMQVLSNGPDVNGYKIKENMIKMIQLAEHEVILQTPYFIPDAVFLSAIKTAIASGVKFKLIIPGKPDKKFVYHATMSFVQEVLAMGGEVYLFNGFMHAKVLVVDDFAMTIGSSNADNRSFALNFEINAVMYDEKLIADYKATTQSILQNSKKISLEYFKQSSNWTKFKQLFFRLFSPLF